MTIKPPKSPTVYITVRDRERTTNSRSLTIHNATIDQVIRLITEAIASREHPSKKAGATKL